MFWIFIQDDHNYRTCDIYIYRLHYLFKATSSVQRLSSTRIRTFSSRSWLVNYCIPYNYSGQSNTLIKGTWRHNILYMNPWALLPKKQFTMLCLTSEKLLTPIIWCCSILNDFRWLNRFCGLDVHLEVSSVLSVYFWELIVT